MSSVHRTAKGTELPIMSLRGKDYLEVKYRLVWFREERPSWSIETEMLQTTDKASIAKATVRDESGRVMATGHKSETAQGFPDHMEKAETGAIGRALALVGYGTQFTGDELEEGARIVDSPVERKKPIPTGGFTRGIGPSQPGPEDGVKFVEDEYKIDFGQWRTKTLREVYHDPALGPQRISSYIDYLEEQAQKKGVAIEGSAKRFIEQAERYLGLMENQEPGVRG